MKTNFSQQLLTLRKEKELAHLKMQMLLTQINPHFIFNSLNSIDYLILKQNYRAASRHLNRFAHLMRRLLKNAKVDEVSLKDDLKALKLYVDIEKLRFRQQFEVLFNIAENIDLDFIRVPPMLLQPYVENAIWHGLLHKKEGGKIELIYELDEEQEVLKCTVLDNGIGREKSIDLKARQIPTGNQKSFGLNSVEDLVEILNLLYERPTNIQIFDLYDEAQNGIGTKVEVEIGV
ncbi:MAG: histidine kinase [Bacteroidota bacterium]